MELYYYIDSIMLALIQKYMNAKVVIMCTLSISINNYSFFEIIYNKKTSRVICISYLFKEGIKLNLEQKQHKT